MRTEESRTLEEKKALLERYSLSSYPGYIFPKHRYPWITYELLEHFGGDSPKGRAAYRRFVEAGLTGKLDDPLERGEVTVSSAMRPSSRGLPALFRRSRLRARYLRSGGWREPAVRSVSSLSCRTQRA